MSLEQINIAYKVTAKLGGKIEFTNAVGQIKQGTIVGYRGLFIKVKFAGNTTPVILHPTYGVEYL